MAAYPTLSDQELLTRLRAGEEAAFTEIYNRYWEKLLATGYFYTHDKHAAEDIVHEVMISLWQRRSVIDIQSLSAYLGTAVKFAVFKSVIRDRRRRDILAARHVSGEYQDIEDKLEARFIENILQGAIEQLPEKARLVFTYSRSNELSISQIAEKMDLSPKAVEYHMTKALRNLRNVFGKIKCVFI